MGGRGHVRVTPWWPMEANSGVRGGVRAAQKALDGMTDRQTYGPSITR